MSDVLVLCYHAVSQRWPARVSVTPASLAAHLGALVQRGYHGVTFSEAVAGAPYRKQVAVTFDDAYRSVLELALPILERLGLPATVFAPTSFIGTGRPMRLPGMEAWLATEHEHELVPLTWEELDGLAARGWEIGSHTCTHPHLTELHGAGLEAEMRESKAACEEKLGRECRAVAYPYGEVDDRVASAAADAGYLAGAELPRRFNRPTPLRWPRTGIYHHDTPRSFALKTSSRFRYVRGLPIWTALDWARSLTGKDLGALRHDRD